MSLGAFLGARLGLFLAEVEGGRRAVEVGPEVLLVAFVLLGGKAEWPPRRVDGLAVRLGLWGSFGRSRWGLW